MNRADADPVAASVSSRPRRVHIDADLAALQRASYGKSWADVACGADLLQVDFQQAEVRRIELQCQLRCAGLRFELQFVEPAALLDLGAALRPGVPAFVQLAAVMHAAQDLLTGLEQCFHARIELVGLSGPAPAWEPHTALGLRVSRRTPATPARAGDGRPAGSIVLLRALEREGWQRVHQATRHLDHAPGAPDPLLEVTLCLDTVQLALAELRDMVAGDVLLLQAAATSAGSPRTVDVSLQIGRVPLPGVRATRSGSQLRIAQLAPGAPARLAELRPASPSPDPQAALPTPSKTMNPLDAVGTSPEGEAPAGLPATTLDAIELDVGLELGSIRLSLSALRTLAVGQVHEAGSALDGETVVLWCGGQRLGLGRLVEVGERLGVRIVALDPQADYSAAPSLRKNF